MFSHEKTCRRCKQDEFLKGQAHKRNSKGKSKDLISKSFTI